MVEELYTVKEAADVLRRGKTALYELLGRGEIAAVKIGSRTLIKRSELDRFLSAAPPAVVRRPAETARREREASHAAVL